MASKTPSLSKRSGVHETGSTPDIQTRQQLTALAGLAPSPYQSSDEARDLGISKAGSSSVRAMAIQIAWGWIRFQPNSNLTRWFERRFAHARRS